jgi:hypothetical protein
MLFCDCLGNDCLELIKRLAKELRMMHLKIPMVAQIWLNVVQTIAPITKFFTMEEQMIRIKSGLDGHGRTGRVEFRPVSNLATTFSTFGTSENCIHNVFFPMEN